MYDVCIYTIRHTLSKETWAVLRQLKKKDSKEILTLSRVTLEDAGAGAGKVVVTKPLCDVSDLSDSLGLPGVQCGSTLYSYNSDDLVWFNVTGVDVTTGATVLNLDTLTLLNGVQYAYVAGLVCV